MKQKNSFDCSFPNGNLFSLLCLLVGEVCEARRAGETAGGKGVHCEVRANLLGS